MAWRSSSNDRKFARVLEGIQRQIDGIGKPSFRGKGGGKGKGGGGGKGFVGVHNQSHSPIPAVVAASGTT